MHVGYDDGCLIEVECERVQMAERMEHPPHRHALARIRRAMKAAIQELKKG
jgi:hypothetical protein